VKHSASSLETWTNCPRLWKAKYLEKLVPYVENPAAKRGTEIHAKLEDGIQTGVTPDDIWTPAGLVESLHRKGAESEVKVGVAEDGSLTEFDSEDVRLRGVMDVYLATRSAALVLDWKTGKVRPKKIQADVYTTFAYALAGREIPVEFNFVYVDQKKVVPLNRDNEAPKRIWDLIEEVEQDSQHLPQPGWLCRFCDFYACRYNENPAKHHQENEK